jgi:hypothetical protein
MDPEILANSTSLRDVDVDCDAAVLERYPQQEVN